MLKKLISFLFLIFMLLFAFNTYAANNIPKVIINGTEVTDISGFEMHADTLYVLPKKAAELFNLTFSRDENNLVYNFSTPTRSVTYDTKTGSVNVSDRRSFAYNIIEDAYPSYANNSDTLIPIRMICSSFNMNIDYISDTHSVIVTFPQYFAGLFNPDGIAVAYKGGNFGIVNSAGNVLLPFKYDDISNYDNPQMFKVVDDHRCGIANRTGKLVTDIIYNEITYVSAGEIYLKIDSKMGMCDIDGRIIIPTLYSDIAYCANLIAMVKTDEGWSLLNCSLNTLSQTLYDEVYEITTGIQTVNNMIKGYYVKKDGKWGCVDSFGNTVIDFCYDALDKFDEMGRARVILNGKFGIVDCGGQTIIPPLYDYIYPFGLSKVTVAELSGKYGVLKLDGSVSVPFEYDYIYSFNNSSATAAYKDGIFTIIHADGTLVTDKTYRYVEEFKNGFALAYSNGYGYIDISGNEIIDCVHSDVKQGTSLSVFLKKDDKWALYSPTGDNITGYIYKDAGEFENGLSAVCLLKDGQYKYGYINDSADEIIPFKFTTAQKFKYGKAIVSLGSQYGIIDIEGNVVIPFEYTGFNPSYDYNVIAAADKSSKWGLISFTNQILTPFEYDYIFEFENGYAIVLKNHKYGVVDTKGNIVVDIMYSSADKALEKLTT